MSFDNKKKFDLAVAWRIYPGVSKTPLIFPKNKFNLVSVCLKSFLASVTHLEVKYYFLLDGCPPAYNQLINEIFENKAVEIIETASVGNLATFKMQIDILSTQEDAEVVYFAEDDYLYIPNEFHKMVSLVRDNNKVDFASCYLHSDTFTHPIHQHKKNTIEFAGHQWLSDSSTCLTFMTTKKTLAKTKDLLLTYSKGNNDCAMWLVMTKTFIYNPLKYIQFYFTNKESFNILKVAVKYSFKYFFRIRKFNLYIANPAIGTHLEKDLVSPDINWIEIAKQVNNNVLEV